MDMVFWIALITGCAASVDDLRRCRIANWIPFSAVAAGTAIHAARTGWQGVEFTAAGAALGFGVFLAFYVLGGMGAGDIKLMAGFGALLGPREILIAAVLAAMAGALLATACLLRWHRHSCLCGQAGDRPHTIPYAPAITLGAWLALLGGG